MQIAHFQHSCILVEHDGARILFDPGTFSHGFEGLTGLDAIVITHQHPDHCDAGRLPDLIAANPDAQLLADPQTAGQLGAPWTAFQAGEVRRVGRVQLTGGGGRHAVIHPDIPVIDNTAVLLGTADRPGLLLHPGDSLWVPPVPVAALALPASAPWMKISETVDYLRSVAPRVAFPIHQAILAAEGRPVFYGRLADMAPAGTEFRVLDEENAVELA